MAKATTHKDFLVLTQTLRSFSIDRTISQRFPFGLAQGKRAGLRMFRPSGTYTNTQLAHYHDAAMECGYGCVRFALVTLPEITGGAAGLSTFGDAARGAVRGEKA